MTGNRTGGMVIGGWRPNGCAIECDDPVGTRSYGMFEFSAVPMPKGLGAKFWAAISGLAVVAVCGFWMKTVFAEPPVGGRKSRS